MFILSRSGKPVYSRYGSEEKLVNLFGIMQALVSIIEDSKDELRYFPLSCCIFYALALLRCLVAGGHKFTFMVKGPLTFVAASQGPEFERQITQQMMYAYNQILSVLTYTQLHNVFERRPNFDLRFLLQGELHLFVNVVTA